MQNLVDLHLAVMLAVRPSHLLGQLSKYLACILLKCGFPSVEALSRLDVVIGHPNKLDPDNIMAYDNAVSALGKICRFHRDKLNAAQVLHTSHLTLNIHYEW